MIATEVVDEVRYASVSDVSRYIRNKSFDGSSDPTDEEVQDLIMQASDLVDNKTFRAWRTRKVTDIEREPEFSRGQRAAHFRNRRRRSSGGIWSSIDFPKRPRAVLFLPHTNLRDWDTSQDQLEILKRESVKDITSELGRGDNQSYIVDERKGVIRIDLDEFTTGPMFGGRIREPPLVRVNYRYGEDESAQEESAGGDGVSNSVPGEVREAVAKIVAADLIHTDQLGALITSGPENVPDQSTAANKLWSSGMSTIERLRRKPHA